MDLNKTMSILSLFFLTTISCTEPYALQTDSFDEAIIIEATITNELKKQEIKISRTYRFEENGPKIEKGAIVFIEDDLGNKFNFTETDDKYISDTEFQAVGNRNYELHIITDEGKSYISTKEKLTTPNTISEILPKVLTKDGVRGVEINVLSSDPSNSSNYYRFEYEETYKIVAPKWVPYVGVVTGPQSYEIKQRTSEAEVCYSSAKSNEILLTSTNNQSVDQVNFPIRFISSQSYIISHRYSILVKQYVQNLKAFTYYQTLKKISNSNSILSQVQPGFFEGNIKSEQNFNEKVIGFFDVSSVSEKRMFFNYSDLFPGEPLPPYVTECNEKIYKYCFDLSRSECKGDSFLSLLGFNLISIYSILYAPTTPKEDIITSFDIKCGDCSSFSSNIKPSFWID